MREASYILLFFMEIGIYILKLLHEIPKLVLFEGGIGKIGIYILKFLHEIPKLVLFEGGIGEIGIYKPKFLYKIPNIEKNWNPRMKKLARESNIMENQGKNQKNWNLSQEKFRLESNSIKLGNKTTR